MDVDKIASELLKMGTEWADKEAAASALEESRKSVRAQIAVSYVAEGNSAAASELRAEAAPDYKAHITSMVNARKEANKAKVRFDVSKIKVDLYRSAEATRRAEANIR